MTTVTSQPANAGPRSAERARRADEAHAHPAVDAGSAAASFEAWERERDLLSLLSRQQQLPLSSKKILEVGCGTGRWLRDLVAWGANPVNLYGVELLEASAARARRLCPPGITIECGNAAQLQSEPESFDIVLQAGLFSSVFDGAVKHTMAAEIMRVLRPGGIVLWYDFCLTNPQNPYVQPISDGEIGRLFPRCRMELHRATLAMPLVRLLAPRSPKACAVLSRVAALCTHYLGVLRKPGVV